MPFEHVHTDHACEHVFGFKGLFLSFPFLFVVFKIRDELRNEDQPPEVVAAVQEPAPV